MPNEKSPPEPTPEEIEKAATAAREEEGHKKRKRFLDGMSSNDVLSPEELAAIKKRKAEKEAREKK